MMSPPPTSDDVTPLKEGKQFVKLNHIDSHVLESTKALLASDFASPLSGGCKREGSTGAENHESTIDDRCVNKDELSFVNNQLSKSKPQIMLI